MRLLELPLNRPRPHPPPLRQLPGPLLAPATFSFGPFASAPFVFAPSAEAPVKEVREQVPTTPVDPSSASPAAASVAALTVEQPPTSAPPTEVPAHQQPAAPPAVAPTPPTNDSSPKSAAASVPLHEAPVVEKDGKATVFIPWAAIVNREPSEPAQQPAAGAKPQPAKRSAVVYGANHLWTDESEEEDEAEKRKERPARRKEPPPVDRDTNSPHVNLLGEPLPLPPNGPPAPSKQPKARGPPKLPVLPQMPSQIPGFPPLQQQQRLFSQAPPLPFLPPPMAAAQLPGYPQYAPPRLPAACWNDFAFPPQPTRPMPPPPQMGGPAGGHSFSGRPVQQYGRPGPFFPKLRAIWTEEDRRQQAAVSTARPAQKTKETRTKKTAEQKRQRAKKPPTAQPVEQKKTPLEETVARAIAQGDLLFERLRKMQDELQQQAEQPTAQPTAQQTVQEANEAPIQPLNDEPKQRSQEDAPTARPEQKSERSVALRKPNQDLLMHVQMPTEQLQGGAEKDGSAEGTQSDMRARIQQQLERFLSHQPAVEVVACWVENADGTTVPIAPAAPSAPTAGVEEEPRPSTSKEPESPAYSIVNLLDSEDETGWTDAEDVKFIDSDYQ
ncbi:hypothetical protein M3Y99_01359000 [Aphelenchoides fujianensis]|nr:hypothetical protein M3Y99_01359000 [Aphelenchoides fujianensis]